MIFINNLSPELINIGPLTVRWYGVLFAAGIVLNYIIVYFAFKREKYPIAHLDGVAIYLFLGMVIGARLGHVFFYNADYFLSNPIDILKIWNGGLASHGAALGVFAGYLIWSKIHKIKFNKYPDILILGFPVTAAFVRIGNFFNSEILGKASGDNFGVIFAQLGEDFPRHPAQIYEAILSIFVFVILILIYRKYYRNVKPLFFMFLYMVLYFIGRFFIEFAKDVPDNFVSWTFLTKGQMLSLIPILISAIYFIFFMPKMKKR